MLTLGLLTASTMAWIFVYFHGQRNFYESFYVPSSAAKKRPKLRIVK